MVCNLCGLKSIAQVSKTVIYKVQSGTDDAEEVATGGTGTVGVMDLTSSDLELMTDGTKKQLIGIRFSGITIPKDAIINSAFIQFTTKGDKNPTSGAIAIGIQDVDNALTFTSASSNISARTKTGAVSWSGTTSSTWGTASGNTNGANQRTPDVKTLVQTVVNRSGWASGNAMAFILTGEGVRNAYSKDGASSDLNYVPTLIINYNVGASSTLTTSSFPIEKNSEWKYLDNGTDQGTAYASPTFDDAAWNVGFGKFGYSDNPTTTLGFGADANNKYITYYFRKKFSVANVNSLAANLKLSLLRDDAAIIYVNGTEVVRDNLPATGVTYLTNSTSIVDGAAESTYLDFTFSKAVLVNGENTIAVEIHQRDGTSSDLGFDLSLEQAPVVVPPVPCDPLASTSVSNFMSVLPSAQPDSLRIPATHAFQMLIQSGTPYTNAANGNMRGAFDFTGYVPISSSSTNGYLSINHEEGSSPSAGVSILDINFNTGLKLWEISNNQPVDFATIAGTGRNCSGAVTPWGTIITAEETLPTSDANSDGFQDIGWLVEIDPVTRRVKDYNNDGTPDKIWKAGRMSHENAVVAADRKTLYEGNDENPGYVWKYVATTAENLSDGLLYVLKLDGSTIENSTTGTWILVPNSTTAECNAVKDFANSVSATNFNSVEDVEISPINNMIYFTSKASSRVYRFKDDGTSVSDFSIFVGNSSTQYAITHSGGTVNESWGSGNDNLTFDADGNLYVIQDGSRNHIWMVKPCHTQASPKVELFAVTPAGSEPTGMTFSPDFKFMFVSIQHPSGSNATLMKDAAGNMVKFNKESAVVIARKEYLGTPTTLAITFTSFEASKQTESKVRLVWAFDTDQENVNFEIERMIANGTFLSVGKLSNKKVVIGQNQFSFVDENPASGENYYRIKAIDADGKISYTATKVVRISNLGQTSFDVFPNPVSTNLNIKFSSVNTGKVNVLIFNTLGVLVKSEFIDVVAGENNSSINLSQLPIGIYTIQVIIDGEKQTKKFIKN